MLQFRAGTTGISSGASITQGDVTLSFSNTAQYVTNFQGENFVKTGATISGWTPAPSGTGTTARNGAMVNPSNADQQGFDGRISAADTSNQITYSNAYNLAFSLPYTPANGESVIIAVSRRPADTLADVITFDSSNPRCISTYEVFTFVDTLPTSTTIRPPWAGTWKPLYTQADVNTSLLGTFSGIADPTTTSSSFLAYNWNYRPYAVTRFIDPMPGIISGDENTVSPSAILASALVPENEQDWYPGNWGRTVSQHMLYTMCNFSNRNTVAYNLVKIGVDYMSQRLLGWRRPIGAGFVGVRKGVAIYAGKLLSNPTVSGTAWDTRMLSTGNYPDATRGWPYTDYAQTSWPEETSWYYSNAAYSGYAFPAGLNPRSPTPSGWPGGYPMYGDNKAGTGSNHSNRDAAGKYVASPGVNSAAGYAEYGIPYQATDNADGVTGNQAMKIAGSYIHIGNRCQVGAVLANRVLGVQSQYNNQAMLDFIDWWMSDDNLRIPVYETIDASKQDIYSGGNGSGFITDCWTAMR